MAVATLVSVHFCVCQSILSRPRRVPSLLGIWAASPARNQKGLEASSEGE